LAQAFGEKKGFYMKKRKEVHYTDNPDIGELEVISKSFLPRPEDLVFKEETEKTTLLLDKSTLEFFRGQARCALSENDQKLTQTICRATQSK